ncbi:MAG: GGDEF domain-containing protein [Cellulomonas sp.]|nr:GGDEF domain-containing protein [Cellulomonas sp.]
MKSQDFVDDTATPPIAKSLFGLLVANLLVVAVAGVFAVRRNRRLAVTVLAPIRGVLSTIDALRSGDLTARSGATGVVELDAVESALSGLASGLAQAQELAAGRAKRLELLAARLETVVRVAREISGSLSVRYVSEAVTTAAAEMLGSPTVLWVRDEEGRFHAASQSDQPHGWVGNDLAVPALVAECADNARTTFDETSRAYPLVLAGMVVGVLRLIATEVDPDVENTLGALLSTAAASLESARLHSAADELALTDALTHLPNRRRMESELEVEWDRSKRYGRPLSFLMIDLDHFKALNDEFGHTVGDEVQRSVATAVQASLRASDTAYRYGGEELAVLLRETGPDDAALVGERIRAAVAAVTLHNTSARVTASVGLAERSSEMRFGIELVAAADAALYVAKKQGRDRVVHLSVLPTEPGRQARPSA